jgi:hypothetical protein
VGVVVGRRCGDAFNGLGLIVGIPVYFAGGFFSVGRCKVRNRKAVIEVDLECVRRDYLVFRGWEAEIVVGRLGDKN